MFSYSAICDVPEKTLLHVIALRGHRRDIGTGKGRRAGSEHTQAKLVLRWFRDDAPIRLRAAEPGLPISTSYRYLHEAIDVIAEQAPAPSARTGEAGRAVGEVGEAGGQDYVGR